MKIGFDLDDVLAELTKVLIEYHNRLLGTRFVLDDHKEYNLWETWGGTREEAIAEVLEFYASTYMDTVEPVEGAVETTNKLAKKHALSIITSRPADLTENTHKWVDKYYRGIFKEIYLTNHVSIAGANTRKADICIQTGVDVMVEDCMKYAQECAEAGILTMLYERAWNKKYIELPKNMIRVYNMNHLEAEIEKLERTRA